MKRILSALPLLALMSLATLDSACGGCPTGQIQCAHLCVSLTTDPLNCGACGMACPSGAACVAGACATSCGAGLTDCTGSCRDLMSDVVNCGACAAACDAGKVCSKGACAVSCQTGLTNCSGSCRDTMTDNANCGACGKLCDAGTLCAAGTCTLSCQNGLTSCGGACRDLTGDEANCGACGKKCDAGFVCAAGMCALSCQAGSMNCGGACRDPMSDPANCGACGTRCDVGLGCVAGKCALVCQKGLTVCNAVCRDLNADPANCGACGQACGMGLLCSMGTCVATCANNLVQCGMACRDTADDAANCGGCGKVCPSGPSATGVCLKAACALQCQSNFADCDKMSADGCEVNLATDASNCGACANKCLAGPNSTPLCANTQCSLKCAPGWNDCDQGSANGCESDPTSDPNNCGACGTRCVSGANSVATCAASACGIACYAGYGNCNNLSADGCEVNVAADPKNCGACGTVCNSTNGIATCSLGGCQIACSAGFGNCNALVTDGCEVNLNTDSNNCGACGNKCAANLTCVAGKCVGAVPAGCLGTTNPKIAICISNNKINTYNTAAQCATCTEKGLTNACVDTPSCTQYFTNSIVEQLYNTRTGLICTAQADQVNSCGWGEIMTANYQAAGNCPTPQDCTSSQNWANCQYGVGSYDAFIYGVCNLP